MRLRPETRLPLAAAWMDEASLCASWPVRISATLQPLGLSLCTQRMLSICGTKPDQDARCTQYCCHILQEARQHGQHLAGDHAGASGGACLWLLWRRSAGCRCSISKFLLLMAMTRWAAMLPCQEPSCSLMCELAALLCALHCVNMPAEWKAGCPSACEQFFSQESGGLELACITSMACRSR
jgi:hypothetical protein